LLFVYVSETETEVYNKVAPVAAVQKPEPPVKVQKTEKPKNEIEHVVKRGEILFDISKRYTGSGWNYRSIARYNHIGNPNVIEVGDVIKIRLK
jgi:nucleoid-associated protein YgaU